MIELGPIVPPRELESFDSERPVFSLIVPALAVLFVLALVTVFALDLAHAQPSSTTAQSAIERALLDHLRLERGAYVLHCRRAHGGCAARVRRMAAIFVRAGAAHDIDPWLLVALALRESGGNPDAIGARGERGLMQLHPGSRAGRDAARLCRVRPDACSAILVDGAARVLRASIDRCGSVESGLVRYRTGHCGEPDAYARSVLARRDRLRGAS